MVVTLCPPQLLVVKCEWLFGVRQTNLRGCARPRVTGGKCAMRSAAKAGPSRAIRSVGAPTVVGPQIESAE